MSFCLKPNKSKVSMLGLSRTDFAKEQQQERIRIEGQSYSSYIIQLFVEY